ncbi:hypothetical protein, variant 1 [Aphanomyces astaci]|uniref:1-phosphatidylinositol 4-kinase n=1 Tax=Aphanomyces astaci TaxID=112090 RepID=W4G724_APHAT|nr:hypothetical protein, variant 1 [Aphanomyces astaci]ETV75512.1 hypothetical protein, variant 1 [Aphanomyces astaci]|eukprot:XP_009835146.1 hypothetical protein, variant 1 [Aphanomyces astaci]
MGHLICCGRRPHSNTTVQSTGHEAGDASEDGVERFRRFWDDKLKDVADMLSLGRAPDDDEMSRNPFHVTLQLYAHKDVVDQLYLCYDEHPDEVEFYIPQLCTFLLHGQYDKNPALEFFLLSQCRRSLQFAHRLHWFLESFCGTTYRSEGLSATVHAHHAAEGGHLLQEIARQGGVPAKLFSMGLTESECAASKELMATRLMALQVAEAHMDSPEHLELFQATPAFVRSLTDLADRLIPLPLAERKLHLHHGLAEIEAMYFPSASTIYLPVGDSMHRVKRVVIDESFPFSTKERVPYLICVEVVDQIIRRPSFSSSSKSYTMKLPFVNHRVTVAISDDEANGRMTGGQDDLNLQAATTSGGGENTPDGRPSSTTTQDNTNKTFVVEARKKSFTLSFRHDDGESTDGVKHETAAAGKAREENDENNNAIKTQVMGQWAKRPQQPQRKQPDDKLRVDERHDVRSIDEDGGGEDQSPLEWSIGSPLSDNQSFLQPDAAPAAAAPVIAFRERWADKQDRLRRLSPYGTLPGWRVVPVIVKSHDDLRQEQFAAQIIAQCHHIFVDAQLPLSLRPYAVLATSATSGLIEAVPDTVSLDSLKKNDPDYKSLLDFYERYFGSPTGSRFKRARVNFIQSLSAYSILCFVFQIKDRHNGNILLDALGHIIHIDFGFLFTNSPGGNIGFESAPFKLTDEFVELMDGPRSKLFREFRSLCVKAYWALHKNMDKLLLLVEMMLVNDQAELRLPCFSRGKKATMDGLRQRLNPGLGKVACQVCAYVRTWKDEEGSAYNIYVERERERR